MVNSTSFHKVFHKFVIKMSSSITNYFSWTTMSTNYIFPYEFYYFFCCCILYCSCFWPLCEIIHCYYYVSISLLCYFQRSYYIYSYNVKWFFSFYWIQLTFPICFSSSLTFPTSSNIFSNHIFHIWPVILFFNFLRSCFYS